MKHSLLSRLAMLSVCFLSSCVADVEPPQPAVLDFGDSHLIIREDTLSLGDTLSVVAVLDSTVKEPLHYTWSVFDSIIETVHPSLSTPVVATGLSTLIVCALDSLENIVWSDTATFFVRSLPTLTITTLEPAVIFSQVTLSVTITDAPGPVTYTWKYSDRDSTTKDPELKAFFTEVKTVSIECEARLILTNELVATDTLHLNVTAPAITISRQQLETFTNVAIRCYAKFTFYEQSGPNPSTTLANLIAVEKPIQGWSDTGSFYSIFSKYIDSATTDIRSESLITSFDPQASTLKNVSYKKNYSYNWGNGYSRQSDVVTLEGETLYLLSVNSDSAVFARGGPWSFKADVNWANQPSPSGNQLQAKNLYETDWYDGSYPSACYVVFKK